MSHGDPVNVCVWCEKEIKKSLCSECGRYYGAKELPKKKLNQSSYNWKLGKDTQRLRSIRFSWDKTK